MNTVWEIINKPYVIALILAIVITLFTYFVILKKEWKLESLLDIYKGVDIEITPNQIFDVRTQLGITTKQALELQYQSVIEKRRNDNLEILLN